MKTIQPSKVVHKSNNSIFNGYKLFIILVLSSFLIRLFFRSNYLDDWDSVQFALAVKDYSIAIHQPHPPGYPVYIFFARIANFFFNDPTRSLTFLSALFGSLSLMPIYLLSKKLFNEKIGLMSAFILSINPLHLALSEVAMSDMVSIFFMTLTIYLLYLGFESTTYLFVASFVLGLTAGIRATDIILVFILLIVLTYRYISRKRDFRTIFISICLVVFGVGIWLVPIIYDTGGIATFIKVEKSQWNYNEAAGTLNGGEPINLVLKLMTNALFNGWTTIGFYFFVSVTLIFIVVNIINSEFNFIDNRFIFVTSWFTIFFLFSMFFHVLYVTRYTLPLVPVLSIIFSYTTLSIVSMVEKRIKILLLTIFIISIIFMTGQGISRIYNISETIPAPVKAAEFIKTNYDNNGTIIIATESFRHLQYYLPNYTIFQNFDIDKIDNYIIENKTIISEDFPITFAPSEVYKFERKKIYPKHETVTLNENKLLKQPIALEKDGWYGFEIWENNISARWIANDSLLRLYSYDNYSNINFNAISFNRPRILEIHDNNDTIGEINVPTKFINISITLKKGLNVIHFHVKERCERPEDYPELKSSDERCISVALSEISET